MPIGLWIYSALNLLLGIGLVWFCGMALSQNAGIHGTPSDSIIIWAAFISGLTAGVLMILSAMCVVIASDDRYKIVLSMSVLTLVVLVAAVVLCILAGAGAFAFADSRKNAFLRIFFLIYFTPSAIGLAIFKGVELGYLTTSDVDRFLDKEDLAQEGNTAGKEQGSE